MSSRNPAPSENSAGIPTMSYGRWVWLVVIAEGLLGWYVISNPASALSVVSIMGIVVLAYFGYAAWEVVVASGSSTATAKAAHVQQPIPDYAKRWDQLNEQVESQMGLFRRNVDECRRVLGELDEFRGLVDTLSQELENDVLSGDINTGGELLARLERAESIVGFTNVELGNLLKKHQHATDPEEWTRLTDPGESEQDNPEHSTSPPR